MKKSLSLLLTAVMLCSMLAMFAVPTLAAPKQGVGVIDITSATQLCNELRNLNDGRTVVFNLKTDMCIEDEVVLEASNCSILIRVDDTYYSKYGDVKIYPNYTTNNPDYRFLDIKGDNVKIYFDGRVICKDFKSIGKKFNPESGGVIYIDGENCLIANALFYDCTAQKNGGAILIDDDDAGIKDCTFNNCRAVEGGGGAICVFDDSSGCSVYQCTFKGNSCVNSPVGDPNFGDDISGHKTSSFGDPETLVQNCTSDSKRKDHFYDCKVLPDTECTPVDTGADIFGTDFSSDYTRPMITDYANLTTQGKDNCDVIRPDILNKTKSDKGFFTIEGKNAYGALWEVTYQDALTITAKDGYTITRIEAVMQNDDNYDSLSIDNGTKKKAIRNPHFHGKSIEADWIAKFEDINAKSVTFITNGNNTNWRAVYFSDFIVYYTKDSALGSVFSGGTLWLIIGVAAVAAIAAAGVIVVVKKKKKPATANGAADENSENEDE